MTLRNPPGRPLVCAVAATIAIGVAEAVPGARQSPQLPTFRASANFVEVDASVLDEDRRPVRGLQVPDFTVLEDGVAQPILTFKEIDIPDPVEPPVAWMRDVSPDVKTNVAASEGRLMALILEDGMIGLDLYTKQIKAIGRRIVDEMGPSDLLAVIFTRDIKKSSDFSGDRRFLLSMIDKFATGHSGMYGDRSMIEAVVKLADFLSEAPQRRKALFYVSPGWPIDFASSSCEFCALYRLRLDEAFDRARRANVNIYPIDPTGLTDEVVAGQSQGNPADLPSGMPQALGLGRPRGRNLGMDFLMILANESGGRAIVNNNEFATGITDIFRENSSYYLLGYRSPNERADGKLRKIEVRVNRPGLTVRARNGYYGSKAMDPNAAQPTPLTRALSGILPTSDIAMQASLTPFALVDGKSKAVAVAVTLAMQQPAPDDRTITTENVRLAVTAFNATGERKGAQWYNATLKLRPGVSDRLLYEVRTHIALEPGRYQIRLGVASALVGKSGSLFYELDVPDFTKPPLSLSGVIVHTVPAIVSPPNTNLAALVPLASTTRRQFTPLDRVTTFARVYQGGKKPFVPVTVKSEVFDVRGDVVFTTSRELSPQHFGGARSADYRLELPISTFGPGPHVLVIEAESPGVPAVRREVRFEIR